MKVVAPAKINLWLSVGGLRSDGYHDIVSVMQTVSLADELSIEEAGAITLSVTPVGAAPEDDTNLVVRAAIALRTATGAARGAAIGLEKRIPSGAGLGGGSADAAAALAGLNELWGTGLSRKALEKIGAQLGADVSFCVRGGTALARGIGADLSPLACPAPLWWVLASSGRSLATGDVYAEAESLGVGSADDPAELAGALARSDVEAIARHLRNDLEAPALSLAPEMASVRDGLRDAGALGVVMSGSGSAWCALARSEEHARSVAASAGGVWTEVVSSGPGLRVLR